MAVQKLPPELKTKWVFYAERQTHQRANFSELCERLKDVNFVHDELLAQFWQVSDKKQSTCNDTLRASGSSMSAAADETLLSSLNFNAKAANKGVVCSNTHGLWTCDAFKKLTPSDRYNKKKKVFFSFVSVVDMLWMIARLTNVKLTFAKDITTGCYADHKTRTFFHQRPQKLLGPTQVSVCIFLVFHLFTK